MGSDRHAQERAGKWQVGDWVVGREREQRAQEIWDALRGGELAPKQGRAERWKERDQDVLLSAWVGRWWFCY